MSGLFRPSAIEDGLRALDECPPSLVPALVTFPVGTVEERVDGLLAWRKSLLRGELPPPGAWPGQHLSNAATQALANSGALPFLRDTPELVDEVLSDLLSSIRRRSHELARDIARRLAELEQLARQKSKKKRDLTDEQRARLADRAEQEVRSRLVRADSALQGAWEPRARLWAEIAEVFEDLGHMLGRGWDLSRSVFRHVGWKDAKALARLLKQLPQIADIVRSLGRLRTSTDGESTTEQVFENVLRLDEERVHVQTPLVPGETKGVVRGDELTRMLASEAALLTRPALRSLWHARRAERALLTYLVEGTEEIAQQVEVEETVERTKEVPRPERGPIVCVIDTSGSMHGVPETVAKALALEALSTAHREKRRALLISYSGPGEIQEHELSLTEGGINSLLTFLGSSFRGGTDAVGAFKYVLKRLAEDEWRKADVLVVTDGEWPATAATKRRVAAAVEEGNRFHGVIIGNVGKTAMHDVCDPVHVFQDWAAVAGWSEA